MDIPDEAIEAAAAAMWKVSPTGWRGIGEPPPFDQARPSAQNQYRQLALISLSTATPSLIAQAWDEGARHAWQEPTPEENREFTEITNIIYKVLVELEGEQWAKFNADVSARALLAAGYRRAGKPRTITTKDELDALPMDAVIRDSDEYVWERWSLFAKTTNWRCAGAPDLVDDEVALPAEVIWEPEQ